jgi:hypothetical protein
MNGKSIAVGPVHLWSAAKATSAKVEGDLVKWLSDRVT